MPPTTAPNAAASPPDPARTTFQFVVGDPGALREATWTVASDSPLCLAFPFLPWVLQPPPQRAYVARSAMVAVIGDLILISRLHFYHDFD
jgi:hypothetical protein